MEQCASTCLGVTCSIPTQPLERGQGRLLPQVKESQLCSAWTRMGEGFTGWAGTELGLNDRWDI